MYIALNATNMVIWQWTVPTRYHPPAHLPIIIDRIPATGITPDQLLDTITGTDTDTADQGHSPNHRYIKAIVVMTPTEAIPGCIIGTVDATIGILHSTIFATTHHIKGHTHVGTPLLTHKNAADLDHALHISQVGKFCISLHPILAELQ